MSITYPATIDVLSNPTSTDLMENATLALDHDQQHANANDAIEALEAKVGADSSAVTTSHDYKLSGVTGNDKAVSKTGSETLTNKTLTAPVINAGSDTTGDIYYRSAGGVFTRLAIGSNTQILQSNGTIPAWVANPSASNASTTVAGIVEAATSAQITAGTGTGETGAALVVTPDALAASAPTFSATNLTNIPQGKLNLVTTDVTFASSTAENTLLSYSVGAGVLSTANVVRVTLHISNLQMFTTATATLRFKYGATTLITKVLGGAATSNFQGKIEFLLAGAGTTSSQNGSISLNLGTDGYIGNGNLTPQYSASSSQGTSAIDSTSSQTLAITYQASSNSGSDTITASIILVEKIA